MQRLAKSEPQTLGQFFGMTEQLCKTDLKFEVNKRFGLHQIKEAI